MKTTIKNITFVAAGAVLATTAGLYAATIDANINSFTQYIQELFVTSDGTPDGDIAFSVNNERLYYLNPITNVGTINIYDEGA